MKAADISDEAFLAAMRRVRDERWEGKWGIGVSRWDIGNALGRSFPEKVVLAKARRLVKRGVIDGCACGCRGDFIPVEVVASPYGGAS